MAGSGGSGGKGPVQGEGWRVALLCSQDVTMWNCDTGAVSSARGMQRR